LSIGKIGADLVRVDEVTSLRRVPAFLNLGSDFVAVVRQLVLLESEEF
jgi:hypothetical protein